MGKIIKRTKENIPAFYQDENGRWHTNQEVKIRGKTYKNGQIIPSDESSNYKRSNSAVSFSNRVEFFAEEKGISYNKMKSRMNELKDSYRALAKYDNIKEDSNGRLRNEKGEFVKETDELKELKEKGYFKKNIDERRTDYKNIRYKVTGS